MKYPKVIGRFPREFEWGVATAAYQIEGAVSEFGRGPSIWDDFSHQPGHILHNDTGDVACDHYHQMNSDVALLKTLGVSHYRFSLSWSRILPHGRLTETNPQGLDFYHRLIDALLSQNIIPVVTLYHWDLPSALQSRGGWLNRDTAKIFADYASFAVNAFGDRVGRWITHNEPWCSAVLGHQTGEHAPGIQSDTSALSAAHHILLSHGLATQAMRATRPTTAIGITLNLSPIYGRDDTPETAEAVALLDTFSNTWYLDPLLRGSYPTLLDTIYKKAPPVADHDMATISQPLDFLGVNYYFSQTVGPSAELHPWPVERVSPTAPLTAMGWPVTPRGLHDLLVRINGEYPSIPLIITENGAAYPDVIDQSGIILDIERIQFLSDHIEAVGTAIGQGVDIRGYYVWSFLDNFEWAYGYSKRFGLFYVDYGTLTRLPKESARWYRDLVHHMRAQ